MGGQITTMKLTLFSFNMPSAWKFLKEYFWIDIIDMVVIIKELYYIFQKSYFNKRSEPSLNLGL